MSGRGIDFLENWIQQNVIEADKMGTKERANELDYAAKKTLDNYSEQIFNSSYGFPILMLFLFAAFGASAVVPYVLDYFKPCWNCLLGDGEARERRFAARRQFWMQYVAGGILLALLVTYLANTFFPK